MDKKEFIILKALTGERSGFNALHFRAFEKLFFETLKDELKDVFFRYKADTHPDHYAMTMECESGSQKNMVHAVHRTLGRLNNDQKVPLDIQEGAAYFFEYGKLTVDGKEQSVTKCQPDEFYFNGIVAGMMRGR